MEKAIIDGKIKPSVAYIETTPSRFVEPLDPTIAVTTGNPPGSLCWSTLSSVILCDNYTVHEQVTRLFKLRDINDTRPGEPDIKDPECTCYVVVDLYVIAKFGKVKVYKSHNDYFVIDAVCPRGAICKIMTFPGNVPLLSTPPLVLHYSPSTQPWLGLEVKGNGIRKDPRWGKDNAIAEDAWEKMAEGVKVEMPPHKFCSVAVWVDQPEDQRRIGNVLLRRPD